MRDEMLLAMVSSWTMSGDGWRMPGGEVVKHLSKRELKYIQSLPGRTVVFYQNVV